MCTYLIIDHPMFSRWTVIVQYLPVRCNDPPQPRWGGRALAEKRLLHPALQPGQVASNLPRPQPSGSDREIFNSILSIQPRLNRIKQFGHHRTKLKPTIWIMAVFWNRGIYLQFMVISRGKTMFYWILGPYVWTKSLRLWQNSEAIDPTIGDCWSSNVSRRSFTRPSAVLCGAT